MLAQIPPGTSIEGASPNADHNGVDRSQIREMLRLTPEQRLARVQDFVESVLAIRALNETRPVAETLQVLARNRVEFIVVGMAAGVLQGVPLTMLDIDIVHDRTSDNVARLLTVLSELKAIYRDDSRNLSP